MLKDTITPREILLKDYQQPAFLIPKVDLIFDLFDGETIVESLLEIVANPKVQSRQKDLFLNGEQLELMALFINDRELDPGQYKLTELGITIFDVPEKFKLRVQNKIYPEKNTALEGLYKSGNIYCTQNEPEGFRRITYFIDRPDIMSRYRTKIIANKNAYPFLLCNGNPVEKGDLDVGRHYVIWEDPFNKPSYLFALVAGDLGIIKDQFITSSKRTIALEIYCDKGNEQKCFHAMDSLKKAMKWDEEVFGLEYDLDIYMIVAVDAFNMGAMENKGLNIFNSRCVLASSQSETDHEFQLVEGVVGHEYFHNWTGNRVTCRDWFQLTLKEGLTVFRDEEFSSDMTSRAVKRIDDVNALRTRQFQEDASPMAHPIRPQSYIEINNFYTSTVYNKGSEVIRMVHTLIGKESFRKGMDKYFELYDGQAVTTEDFLNAMEIASGVDLKYFSRWYHQAGTPIVKVDYTYDKNNKELVLNFEQSCPATPGQPVKENFYIPIAIGLLDKNGKDIIKKTEHPYFKNSQIVHLKEKKQTVVFKDIENFKAISLNRNFTAPIKLDLQFTSEDWAFLMAHDSDALNRWDAGQQLSVLLIKQLVSTYQNKKDWIVPVAFVKACENILNDSSIDPAFKAMALTLPGVGYLANLYKPIPIEEICAAREFLKHQVGLQLEQNWLNQYETLNKSSVDSDLSFKKSGERALKNLCLQYLLACGEEHAKIALNQFKKSKNMTDRLEAMTGLAFYGYADSSVALNQFFNEWKEDKLVLNKWFEAQAQSKKDGTVENVLALTKNSYFDKALPNNVYSLLRRFAHNYFQFHHPSGKGYELIADMVLELDSINPTTAAVIANCFNTVDQLDEKRKALVFKQLKRIVAKPDLARATFEIVSKFLAEK